MLVLNANVNSHGTRWLYPPRDEVAHFSTFQNVLGPKIVFSSILAVYCQLVPWLLRDRGCLEGDWNGQNRHQHFKIVTNIDVGFDKWWLSFIILFRIRFNWRSTLNLEFTGIECYTCLALRPILLVMLSDNVKDIENADCWLASISSTSIMELDLGIENVMRKYYYLI